MPTSLSSDELKQIADRVQTLSQEATIKAMEVARRMDARNQEVVYTQMTRFSDTPEQPSSTPSQSDSDSSRD